MMFRYFKNTAELKLHLLGATFRMILTGSFTNCIEWNPNSRSSAQIHIHAQTKTSVESLFSLFQYFLLHLPVSESHSVICVVCIEHMCDGKSDSVYEMGQWEIRDVSACGTFTRFFLVQKRDFSLNFHHFSFAKCFFASSLCGCVVHTCTCILHLYWDFVLPYKDQWMALLRSFLKSSFINFIVDRKYRRFHRWLTQVNCLFLKCNYFVVLLYGFWFKSEIIERFDEVFLQFFFVLYPFLHRMSIYDWKLLVLHNHIMRFENGITKRS